MLATAPTGELALTAMSGDKYFFCASLLVAIANLATSFTARASAADDDGAGKGPAVTFSGTHRARLESLNPQFRPGLGANDSGLALRTTLKVDVAWPKWQFVGELMDSRLELTDRQSVLGTGNVNTLEPIEIVAVRKWSGIFGSDSSANLRLGRITVDLSTRRLIPRNGYRNTTNSFVGADWQWQGANEQRLRTFYMKPTPILPRDREALYGNDQEIDDVAHGTIVRGIQYGRPLTSRRDRIEGMWIGLNDTESTTHRNLDTWVVRLVRPAASGQWNYDVEYMHQRGHTRNVAVALTTRLNHEASSWHFEAGYTFSADWSPRFTLIFDTASGDSDPNDTQSGRFDRLFGPARPDFGPVGLYGPTMTRSNMNSPALRVLMEPLPDWRVNATYRAFRLESARDAWVATGLRDASGQSGRSVGRQLEVNFFWRPSGRRVSADVGFARFSKGSFVRSVEPSLGETSLYYYAAMNIAFGQ